MNSTKKPEQQLPATQERMTVAERMELGKVVRMRARVTRNDIDSQQAELLAQVERQLAAKYSFDDKHWTDITHNAAKLITEADAQLAEQCRRMGIPESFRPKLSLSWYDRGENAMKQRRSELRAVAEAELKARALAAKVTVDRSELDLLTKLAASGLTTSAAQKFLEEMPTVQALMPKVTLAQLEERNPIEDAPLELDD